MIKILKAYGIPDIIVHAIEDTYQGTKAKVITLDGDTDEFDILAGVLQGDTLAPYLFIIVLNDYCLWSAIEGKEERLGFTIGPRRSRRVGPVNITDLDFADDIALLSDTAAQAQELLSNVENAALRVGLHTNLWYITSLLVLRSIRWMAAERLQILGVVGSEHWAGHQSQKSDGLEGM